MATNNAHIVIQNVQNGNTTATRYGDGIIVMVTKNAACPKGLTGPVVAGEHRVSFKPGRPGYAEALAWMA